MCIKSPKRKAACCKFKGKSRDRGFIWLRKSSGCKITFSLREAVLQGKERIMRCLCETGEAAVELNMPGYC